MEESQLDVLAQELYSAERETRALEPLTRRHPGMSMEDGYRVQAGYAALRTGAGARLVGRKVGATSAAIQEYFGVHQPDFGHLFDDMEIADGAEVSLSELIQPRVEAELAFLLERPLRGPGVGVDEVLAATGTIRACIEVIDSRIRDWEIDLADTVADNGSSARYVLGTALLDPGDLRTVMVEVRRGDEVVASGAGAAVLGHPAAAVAWLVNTLGDLGAGLAAGDVVLSGSFTTALECAPGDCITAIFRAGGGPPVGGSSAAVSCAFVR